MKAARSVIANALLARFPEIDKRSATRLADRLMARVEADALVEWAEQSGALVQIGYADRERPGRVARFPMRRNDAPVFMESTTESEG